MAKLLDVHSGNISPKNIVIIYTQFKLKKLIFAKLTSQGWDIYQVKTLLKGENLEGNELTFTVENDSAHSPKRRERCGCMKRAYIPHVAIVSRIY